MYKTTDYENEQLSFVNYQKGSKRFLKQDMVLKMVLKKH